MDCKICQLPNPEPSHFWKTHKIKESQYYETYFPRFDLLTNQQIQFKNRDTYFLTDFENRVNLNKYLLTSPNDDVKQYCINYLNNLRESKNLIFFPSQVELRSRIGPGMKFLLKIFGDYDELCNSTGLKSRQIDVKNHNKTEENFISVDSREQLPFKLDLPIQTSKLDFGDYCLGDSKNADLFIERKSLPDFISSFGTNVERLQREFYRARLQDKYIVVLIESKIEDALNFRYLPWISKRIKTSPDFVFHNVRNLLRDNNFLQFLFVDGRSTAQNVLIKLLKNPQMTYKNDLQYLFDCAIL